MNFREKNRLSTPFSPNTLLINSWAASFSQLSTRREESRSNRAASHGTLAQKNLRAWAADGFQQEDHAICNCSDASDGTIQTKQSRITGAIRGHCDGNLGCRRWAEKKGVWRWKGVGRERSSKSREDFLTLLLDGLGRVAEKFPTRGQDLRVSQSAPPRPPTPPSLSSPGVFCHIPHLNCPKPWPLQKRNPKFRIPRQPPFPPSSPTGQTTAKMAPPKRTTKPAQENISLGPQVREGKFPIIANNRINCTT